MYWAYVGRKGLHEYWFHSSPDTKILRDGFVCPKELTRFSSLLESWNFLFSLPTRHSPIHFS